MKVRLRYICVLMTLGLFSFDSVKHDFHTSLTEMNYNPSSNSFEITMRVFTDDFQEAIEQSSGKKNIVLNDEAIEPFVKKYINRHFAFVKGKEVKFANYLGIEAEPDASWIYLELPYSKELESYSILNTILMELFDDQNNLLNLLKDGGRHTLIFAKDTRLQTYPL
ncbi:DUF6702 family protein [uncultured Arcticibacterium sp.]|uniref:DUF6702 family protein n=1 Tax=uncultured Arcticibacterium sp. TaxID=2173042 RepID=UPI0030F9FF01